MDERLVVEGKVQEENGFGAFLHIEPKSADGFVGYSGESLLSDFLGKRVRVTIEVIDDEDQDADP